MTFGRGAGRGVRGGMGFGFRGSSPPWPYIGRGRGGLPRCGYFLNRAAGAPPPEAYYPEQTYPYADSGYASYAPAMSKEQELDFLKNEAEAIKGQIEQIDARMLDLETGE